MKKKKKKKENYLYDMKQSSYDMGHLTIARCLLAEEGPFPLPPPKKCVLVKIKGF